MEAWLYGMLSLQYKEHGVMVCWLISGSMEATSKLNVRFENDCLVCQASNTKHAGLVMTGSLLTLVAHTGPHTGTNCLLVDITPTHTSCPLAIIGRSAMASLTETARLGAPTCASGDNHASVELIVGVHWGVHQGVHRGTIMQVWS